VNRLWARLGRAAPFVVVAIIVSIFRSRHSVDVDDVSMLKG